MKTIKSRTSRSDQQGQVSLFVALVFQVLFIFFAMVINVGMLVHQKINLQNSVDIAAYYGAMKQAEMLNVVAHINYQIRQAYKLMMFRYHQLGTAGELYKHPHKFTDPKGFRTIEDTSVDFEPSFCIAYAPFSNVNSNETYCKSLEGVTIQLPGDPALSSVSRFFFLSLAQVMDTLSRKMIAKAQEGCRAISVLNWRVLAQFINIYKMDLENRRRTLLKIANAISLDEPLDLEGKSVRTGVYKTLFKNLTSQNQDSLASVYGKTGLSINNKNEDVTFQFINGLNYGECGPKSSDTETPGWLSDIFIYPVFRFLDAACTGMTDVKFFSEYININPEDPNIPRNRDADFSEAEMNTLRPLLFESSGNSAEELLKKSSLGYEKNPWCMAYVGVKASTSPIIPFSPFGSVKMEARSFAKPFGGRIGPWYGSTWPASSKQSQGLQTDMLAAVRVQTGPIKFDLNDPGWKEYKHNNFSRYAGDQVGYRSNLTTGQFGQAIHNFKAINLNWWKHPLSNEGQIGYKDTYNDPLAWDEAPGQPQTMRQIEITSIAPDQFDNTYYSIEPDYYNNYLQTLRKAYGQSLYFRGDLGAREKTPDDSLLRFSVRDQVKTAINSNVGIDVKNSLLYQLENPFDVLTAFQSKTPEEHVLDEERFGKCLNGEIASDNPKWYKFTPGACAVGGRTGYSVKLISKSIFNNDLELGGEGINGKIKNPPPEGF